MSAQKKKAALKSKFRHNYDGEIYPGKKMDTTSHVVPDDALTIQQLLVNHTRGIEFNQPLDGFYSDVTEIPTFFDISEAQEFYEDLQLKQKHLKTKLEEFVSKHQEAQKVAPETQPGTTHEAPPEQ